MAQKLPRGILPDGITVPPGTDIMQFCRDLAESGAEFAEQFDRNSDRFHNGVTTPVPMGGIENGRVPESMGGGTGYDWKALPEAPIAIEEDFGPDYHAAMAAHKQLGECKKSISVLNKPVEMVMKLRVQYKGAEGDDKTALESRLKGAETSRDGALASATEVIRTMKDGDISERTRNCVSDVVERGKFHFEDKETFGEYMQVLQRCNQAIFADQKKLLERIKDIKKAAKTSRVTSQDVKSEAVAGAEDSTLPGEKAAGGA